MRMVDQNGRGAQGERCSASGPIFESQPETISQWNHMPFPLKKGPVLLNGWVAPQDAQALDQGSGRVFSCMQGPWVWENHSYAQWVPSVPKHLRATTTHTPD